MLTITDKLVPGVHPTKSDALHTKTRFPLLRRLSIVSLVAMLATASILIFLYRQDQLTEHKVIAADENERTLIYLTSSFDEQINTFVANSAGLDAQAMRANTRLDSLFASGLNAINENDVLKLKIYNLDGVTIYSSAKSEIGGTSKHPDLLARAMSGETVHHMEYRDTFLGKFNKMQDVDVSLTYMPLTHAGKRIGAIEIYDDATQLFNHLFTNSLRIVLIVLSVFGSLYAALFFSLSRTDRAIAKWQDTISENEKSLKEAQLIAGLGSYAFDISAGLWKNSDVLNKLLGITEAYKNSVDGWASLVHPNERTMMLDYLKNEVLGRGKNFDKEYRIIRHDDKAERWVHGLGQLEFDAQGHPVRMLGTIQDITERKMIEAALRESESRRYLLEQQEILQTSLDGYWVVNLKDARILDANDAYCDMVGYTRQELLTMCISDLEAVETPAETAAHIKIIMEKGYDRFETLHCHKQGHLINLEASVSYSAMDGGRMFAFIRDITERYRAEESRRQSYEEIEDLYNDAACGYHSLDKDGVICRINDTELGWLGYTRDEVVGKVKFADLLTPVDAQSFWSNFPVLKLDGFIRDIECEIIRKDGTIFVGFINATAIYDPCGNYVMSRTAVVDITELKRAELESRELSKHLQIVREEEKASFAREIHDELGSTLAALKMDASWLAGKLSTETEMLPLQECVKSMSALLDTAVKSTRRIITDLRPSILDDYGLLAAIKWQAEQFQKRTGVECRVVCPSCEDYDCEDKLDKMQSINLFRIFQEALTNVTRHSGASRVEAEFLPGNNEVILSISDNGRGLPEGHTIAPTSFGIRGMRERVVQLGGKIKFDTPSGGGFSLTVILPVLANNMRKI